MSNALVTRDNHALATASFNPQAWQVIREQAAILHKSGFLPDSIKTPEQAIAIVLTGNEVGIGPMAALRAIHVIKGRPTISAGLMKALIFRDHGDEALIEVESTNQRCTYQYKRRDWKEFKTKSFTIEQAKTAELTGNPTWKKFPEAMLIARCISAIAQTAFTDTILGLYTPEELGAEVSVSDNGEVVVSETAPPRSLPAFQTTTKEGVKVDVITGEIIEDAKIVTEMVEPNGGHVPTKQELNTAIQAYADRLAEERGIESTTDLTGEAIKLAAKAANVKGAKWSDDDKRAVVDFITLELSKPLQEMAF